MDEVRIIEDLYLYTAAISAINIASYLMLSDIGQNSHLLNDANEEHVTQAMILLRDLSYKLSHEGFIETVIRINRGTACMIDDIKDQREIYLANMSILHQQLKKKWIYVDGNDAERMLESEKTLASLVADLPEAVYHDRYLHEIEVYWRRYSGRTEARHYEDAWEYVAGRHLRLE